jgi:hypothetical protein
MSQTLRGVRSLVPFGFPAGLPPIPFGKGLAGFQPGRGFAKSEKPILLAALSKIAPVRILWKTSVEGLTEKIFGAATTTSTSKGP